MASGPPGVTGNATCRVEPVTTYEVVNVATHPPSSEGRIARATRLKPRNVIWEVVQVNILFIHPFIHLSINLCCNPSIQ
jgi:hypothetical protein